MTSYAKREIVTTRIEYGVEAGSDIGTLRTILGIAWADYCDRTGASRDYQPDDWARIIPRDEETVIAFEVEKEVKR